jgi:hypothetical protein
LIVPESGEEDDQRPEEGVESLPAAHGAPIIARAGEIAKGFVALVGRWLLIAGCWYERRRVGRYSG